MPHNVVYSLIGAGLLWVGWFGFNAGSALSAGGLATSAFAATDLSPAAAALSWTFTEWRAMKGKPSVWRCLRHGGGPGDHHPRHRVSCPSPPAFCIGLVAGVVCDLAVTEAQIALRLRRFARRVRRAWCGQHDRAC